jgi:hypothetical protein
MVCRGHQRLSEVSARKDGDVLVEGVPEVVEPPLAHHCQRGQAFDVIDVIEHPDLIPLAERRWPPTILGGHNHASPSADGGIELRWADAAGRYRARTATAIDRRFA